MHTIDLNCDMGEGTGNDGDIMPYISSANIACGYHAGNEETMQRTTELALKYGVAVGAHPGFADKKNFGRLEQVLPPAEIYGLVTGQVYILRQIAGSLGAKLHHVKPHGALYNMAAKDEVLAKIIATAVKDVDENLILYGLYNSFLTSAAKEVGLKTANEVFADRKYNRDGSLVPRNIRGSLIEDDEEALNQALNMVLRNQVITIEGDIIPLNAQTVCLHGDGKHAAAFVKKIYEAFKAGNIKIQRL